MKETIFSQSLIADLSSQELTQFEDYVTKDVKNSASADEVNILKSNLELWLYCLSSIRRSVEYHLASRSATKKSKLLDMVNNGTDKESINSFRTSESEWRVNAIKFLSTIEKKTLYVKMLTREQKQLSNIQY